MVADNATACLNKGVGGLVSSLSATCDMQHALLHTSVETVAVTVVVSQTAHCGTEHLRTEGA